MSTNLPYFRYHPDPVASESIRESDETCACCNRNTGWIYTATFFTAQDVSGRFCPWCIADGSAAERFEGEFTDAYGLDGVSEETLVQVTRRTPVSTPGRIRTGLSTATTRPPSSARSDTRNWQPTQRPSTSFDSTFG